jgi:hypothetical protein
MVGTAMPETAVNEHGNALAAKDEVWAAGNVLVSAPASDAGGAENGRQL